jgi:tuberous sclerosis protein 2
LLQVIFHVATLMPTNLEKDPQCNKKKRHIGNDFVAVVYNDAGSGQNYKLVGIVIL